MSKLWACYAPELVHYFDERAQLEGKNIEETKAFLDLAAFESSENILSIEGGIASIRIEGILSKSGPGIIDRILGRSGTAYHAIIEAIAEAEESPDVEKIALIMDTPGGEVNGVDEVYQAVAGATKPVTAVNTGLIASAGYWIASAADQIIADSAVVETGALGVVVTALDKSGALAKAGIKVVKVASENAPNKVVDLNTDEGIEEIQGRVNALERVFISRVAVGRGVSEEKIKADFGRGSVLIAHDPGAGMPDALSAGMIDSVIYTPTGSSRSTGINISASTEQVEVEISKGDVMNEEELKALIAGHEQLKADHADLKARVERALPYLIGTDYPGAIRTLAVQVLDGKAEAAELKGAIVALDALREETIATAAVVDTDAVPEVITQPIDAPTASEDGIIRNDLDFQATVARLNANRGIVR